jgi:hypothetical protein
MGFLAILHLYGPTKGFFDKTWKPRPASNRFQVAPCGVPNRPPASTQIWPQSLTQHPSARYLNKCLTPTSSAGSRQTL